MVFINKRLEEISLVIKCIKTIKKYRNIVVTCMFKSCAVYPILHKKNTETEHKIPLGADLRGM